MTTLYTLHANPLRLWPEKRRGVEFHPSPTPVCWAEKRRGVEFHPNPTPVCGVPSQGHSLVKLYTLHNIPTRFWAEEGV
jgi:hypothetical protein